MMRKARNIRLVIIVLAIGFLCDSCVNIHPVSRRKAGAIIREEPAFWQYWSQQADIELRVSPCLSIDCNLQYFDANLTSVGITPVFVKLTNRRERPIHFDPANFKIRLMQAEVGVVGLADLRELLFEKYEVKFVNEKSQEDFRQQLHDLMLPTRSIAPGESAWGVVFFGTRSAADSFHGQISLVIPDMELDGQRTRLIFPLQSTR